MSARFDRRLEDVSLVPEAERSVKFHACPQCDGEGLWRPGNGPAPRPMTITVGGERSVSTSGDSMTYGPGDDVGWVICGECHGTGWTTFGNRVGRARSDRHGSSPSCSHCHRCGTGWEFIAQHSTTLNPGRGTFPMCERCWQDCTPAERLPYYRLLWEHWRDAPKPKGWTKELEPWVFIYAAVMHEGIFGDGYGEAPFTLHP